MCPTEDVGVSLSTGKSPEDRNEVTGNLQKCCTLLSLFKDQNELPAFKDGHRNPQHKSGNSDPNITHGNNCLDVEKTPVRGRGGTGNGVYDHSHLS